MYCNRCGNNIPPDSQFCNRCGNKVQGESRPHRVRSIPAPRVRPARRRLVVGNEFEEAPIYYEEEEPGSFVQNNQEEELERTEEEETIFTIFPAFYEVATQYMTAILLSVAVTAFIAYLKFPLWIALAFAGACFIKPI